MLLKAIVSILLYPECILVSYRGSAAEDPLPLAKDKKTSIQYVFIVFEIICCLARISINVVNGIDSIYFAIINTPFA